MLLSGVEEMAWPSDFDPSSHLSEPLKILRRSALLRAVGGSRTLGSSEEQSCRISRVEDCQLCVLLLTTLQSLNF